MNSTWIVNVMDKVGFSCYDVIDVLELIDLGDTYNLITGGGDIFLEKNMCVVNKKVINEYSHIISIEYNTDTLSVYMERVEPLAEEIAC